MLVGLLDADDEHAAVEHHLLFGSSGVSGVILPVAVGSEDGWRHGVVLHQFVVNPPGTWG